MTPCPREVHIGAPCSGARDVLGRGLALLAAVVVVACCATALPAQVPILYALSAQQNPPGMRWQRIDTPHFTVIFPQALDREAQRAATLLERSYEPLTRSLARKPEHIPVVLNNSSAISNAFVAWGPRRSQWYAMPNTTVDMLGPVEWYSLLAVHEGRHIVQERAVRTGIIGVLSRLFGDNTTAFFGGALYFPAWFWEGDAVGMETALTADGRGRQPSFTQRIRALSLDGQRYPYYPAWQGSYRTYYPDWYELGYVLTTHVRRTYGDSVWRRVITRAARNPVAPLALDRALKHETGRSLVELHLDAVHALDSLWRAQQSMVAETPARVLQLSSADYREFTLPQFAGDGSIIALYTDLSTTKRLVRIRDGKIEVLHTGIGLYGELQFHVSGKTVVWSEYEVSPRWGEQSFLVIKTLDLDTREVRTLTHRSRYFAPALSPDGSRIAAVHFSPARQATIALLDARTGSELRRIPNEPGQFLVTPTWAPDGRALYVVAIHPWRGNALVRVPVDGAPSDTIIPFTHDAISRPVATATRVYFGSPRSGIDNVHVVDLATRAVFQVTSRRLGAMWPSLSPRGDRLAFSDYSVHGYDVAEMSLDSSSATPVTFGDAPTPPFAAALVQQEQQGSILDSLPDTTWESRPFTGWSRLFDFHSRTLAPSSDGVNTGLAFESRNVLNTVGLVIGPTFNANEETFALEGGVSYAGLPVIADLSARIGSRASTYADSVGAQQGYSWREQSVAARLRLPLTRLNGQVRQSLVASAALGRTHISEQPVAFRYENGNGDFSTVSYMVSASQVRSAAHRALYPVGAVLTGVYTHTPFGSDFRSHQASIVGAAYLPGFRRDHALVLDAAREEQRPENYRFSSWLRFPRGYDSRFHETLSRAGVTYYLPLFYPDMALGNWLYFRRVQANVFGDVGRGEARDGSQRKDYRSVGSEVTVDVSPFGLRATLRMGVRVSRTLTNGGRTVAAPVIYLQ